MFESLTDWLLTPITALFKWLNDFIEWLFKYFNDLPSFVFDWFADGIISFFNIMPVPDFFNNVHSGVGSIPSGVWFFCGCLNFTYGVTVVFSAYLLRFILRRIPFIG